MTKLETTLQDRSAVYGFIFYFLALLIWSIYDYVKNEVIGLQLPIMFIGFALYLWVKVLRQQKIIKASIEKE